MSYHARLARLLNYLVSDAYVADVDTVMDEYKLIRALAKNVGDTVELPIESLLKNRNASSPRSISGDGLVPDTYESSYDSSWC